MGMYAVDTADVEELSEMSGAAGSGRTAAIERRRALSAGRTALAPIPERVGTGSPRAALPPPAVTSQQMPRVIADQPAPDAAAGAEGRAASAGSVSDAHLGRVLSLQRRRQLSQGKGALMSAAERSEGAPTAPAAPAPQTGSAGSVSDAHLGRVLSLQRRRQLSQGKQALGGAAEPPEETQSDADDTVAGRLERGDRPSIVPTVKVPPPQGGPLVTRQRLGAAVQITGDEAGRGLPVSGSRHILADGSRTAPGAASKVGLVRTAHGLVVSGSTVRSRVAVTGDDFGEHLLITGEADQKLDDDLTPRRGDTYSAAQFPRRSDPHGTSAVSRQPNHRPGASASSGGEPVRPPETSLTGLGITGTALGRSGRVTGDEAGACRILTGDQYQGFAVDSSECGGTGGGTAPAAHSSGQRLDPVTGRKVTESQTVGGQPVTGPDVQHRHHLHGGELRRPVSGTAYQEPSGDSHPGEPDAAGSPTQALVAQVDGMAVTGNVPRYSEAVTGIERGRHSSVTGTSYHQNMRSAQPVNVGGFYAPAAFPVAVAAPGKGHSDASTQDLDPGLTASRAPASSTPGQITGSFAIGQGKVTGNQEFLPLRGPDRGSRARTVTGEGSVAGRTVTGSAWTAHELVTGTEGHIAAGRNPSEGDRGSHAWAGADKFKDRGRTEAPSTHLTGQAGSNKKVGAKVTLSGGAQA